MKFEVAGSKIICKRPDNTATGDDVYRHVVEFDADVDIVPPHVAERLTSIETLELQKFIADRQPPSATTTEINLLEAVPGMIREATGILKSVDQVNKNLYQQLAAALAELEETVGKVRPPRKSRRKT